MPMEHIICPECRSLAQRMPVLSYVTRDNFYLCEVCNQVSFVPKDGTAPPALMSPGSALTRLRAALN